VPIYLILTHRSAADLGERRGLSDLFSRPYADRLEQLAATTGGRVYYVRPAQDLTATYGEILAELRSQYVLGYYPQAAGGEAFRKLEVEVARRGLTARTLSGYFPGR